MAYLTRWRLQLAAQALATTPRGVADIAGEVGYESEAAFNRAFKRLFGTPPARYRREHRLAATVVAPGQVQLSGQANHPVPRRSLRPLCAATAERSHGYTASAADVCRAIADRRPSYALIVIATLALGIGANTAIFSILHALVLRSLPVADPARLVVVMRNGQPSQQYPLFVHFQQHSKTVDVLAFRTAPWRFSAGEKDERITGALVSGSYFSVLGVSPALGTAITNEDDSIPGSGGPRGPVAVLSHGFWMRQFGGEPGVIGSSISAQRPAVHDRRCGAARFQRDRGRTVRGRLRADDDAADADARYGRGAQRTTKPVAADHRPLEARRRRRAGRGRADLAAASLQRGHSARPGDREIRRELSEEPARAANHPGQRQRRPLEPPHAGTRSPCSW